MYIVTNTINSKFIRELTLAETGQISAGLPMGDEPETTTPDKR